MVGSVCEGQVWLCVFVMWLAVRSAVRSVGGLAAAPATYPKTQREEEGLGVAAREAVAAPGMCGWVVFCFCSVFLSVLFRVVMFSGIARTRSSRVSGK